MNGSRSPVGEAPTRKRRGIVRGSGEIDRHEACMGKERSRPPPPADAASAGSSPSVPFKLGPHPLEPDSVRTTTLMLDR